jgi:hypothetical protein
MLILLKNLSGWGVCPMCQIGLVVVLVLGNPRRIEDEDDYDGRWEACPQQFALWRNPATEPSGLATEIAEKKLNAASGRNQRGVQSANHAKRREREREASPFRVFSRVSRARNYSSESSFLEKISSPRRPRRTRRETEVPFFFFFVLFVSFVVRFPIGCRQRRVVPFRGHSENGWPARSQSFFQRNQMLRCHPNRACVSA